MSVLDLQRVRALGPFDRRQRATGLGGAAMLTGLALATGSVAPGAVAIVVAGAGAAAGAALLAGPTVAALNRNRALGLVVVLVGLGALWLALGIRHASSGQWYAFPVHDIASDPFVGLSYDQVWPATGTGWPGRIGGVPVLPTGLMLVCALGGLVLIADAARLRLGLAPLAVAQRAPWQLLTSPAQRRGPIARRILTGVALVGLGAFLAIGVGDQYVGADAPRQALVLILVGAWSAVLIGSPLLIGSLMGIDRDEASRAREEERARFAAHLHDSVLQTLALVQRQANDPAAVVRLARRQEHALRAWLAGEAELASETLVAALREAVAEVEDEHEITVELTAIGDRALDARGEAMVAAAREALRNAARHAPGAPALVFCEIAGGRAEVFVRDQGPGFDPETVASERRGIRDAIIGRMALVGGHATIESSPGEGTEVALSIDGQADGR
ncbi:MAG: sensor histidine kinase [Solirubrobacteraceae bacterium]